MSLRIIAGKYKNQVLKTPKSNSTRPTQNMVREAVFNICQGVIEDANFLDLFAGSGSMGFEALSRGALHATFVEQNRIAASCIMENSNTLGVKSQVTLLTMPANRAIEKLKKNPLIFDIVYIDPPYDMGFNLDSIAPLTNANSLIFIEERHTLKKTETKADLKHFRCTDVRRFATTSLSTYLRIED